MKLILDADIPRSFFYQLQDKGYDVIDVRDITKTAPKDEEIFNLACEEKRILTQKSSGIIVLRTYLLPKQEMFKIILKALQIPEEQLRGTLVIAQIDRLRFHR